MGRILGILEWNNWQKPGNNKLKPSEGGSLIVPIQYAPKKTPVHGPFHT